MPIPFIGALISPIVNAVSSFVGKRQDNKAAEKAATANWETAMGRSMENGWKDEYVTVVVTFPLWQIFIGYLYAAFTGEQAIIIAQAASMKQIGILMGTPYGDLLLVVVLAAVGIKTAKLFK